MVTRGQSAMAFRVGESEAAATRLNKLIYALAA